MRPGAGVHGLHTVLLILVDKIVLYTGRAGGRASTAGLVRPTSNGDRVSFLAPVERRYAVPDKRDVVVEDPLIEGIVHQHALMSIRRAGRKGERPTDGKTAYGHAIRVVEIHER